MVNDATTRLPWLADLWRRLDSIAVAVGDHRFSLADGLGYLIVALAIYVVAKLLFWLVKRGLRRTKRLDSA